MKRKWEFNREEISQILAKHVRKMERDQTLNLSVMAQHGRGGRLLSIIVTEIPKQEGE
jgi:hypothetical protein